MNDKETVKWALEDARDAYVTTGIPSIVPAFSALQLERDVELEDMDAHLLAGMYHADADGNVFMAVFSIDGDPAEFAAAAGSSHGADVTGRLEMVPVKAGGHVLKIYEVPLYAAIQSARENGDAGLERLIIEEMGLTVTQAREKRPRKPKTKSKTIETTNTKVEKTMFAAQKEGLPPLTVSSYNGAPIPIRQGYQNVNAYLSLSFSDAATVNLEAINRAESYLNDVDRAWLTALNSVVIDNPFSQRVYGSDILKRLGVARPLREDHAATMAEAYTSIRKMSGIKMNLDTSEENLAYECRGNKRVIRSITGMGVVNGNVTLSEYSDGTVDFHVDLLPVTPDSDMTTALPLLMYAQDKRQFITAKSDVMRLPAGVTRDAKRCLLYVLRQATSTSQKHAGVIKLETMARVLRIDFTDRDKRSRICRQMARGLDEWKRRGYVSSWKWRTEGRRRVALEVEMTKEVRTDTKTAPRLEA